MKTKDHKAQKATTKAISRSKTNENKYKKDFQKLNTISFRDKGLYKEKITPDKEYAVYKNVRG